MLGAAGVPFIDQDGEGPLPSMILRKSQGHVGCILSLVGMGVAFLAADPRSFYNVMQFFVFDYSPNQPLTGLGLAVAALGGIILARTDEGGK
jgi:hypothetical protein